jgi:hypothetical protein
MKKIYFKRVCFLLFLFTFLTVIFAFNKIDRIKDIQDKLIYNNFLDLVKNNSNYRDFKINNLKAYPDTLTFFHDTTNVEKETYPKEFYLIRTIESSYYSSPAYTFKYLDVIFKSNFQSNDFEDKFQNDIGLKPFTQTLITADNKKWNFWSGIAVEKVFNKYYGSPDNIFENVTYGYIYDIAAKNYMRDYIKILNFLLHENKEVWKKACDSYYKKAMKDVNFDGNIESSMVVKKLLNNGAELKLEVIDTNYLYLPVGELMRRQIDNSLPNIIKCIKIILNDYDKEALYQLKV